MGWVVEVTDFCSEQYFVVVKELLVVRFEKFEGSEFHTTTPFCTSTSSSTLSAAYSTRFQVFKLPVVVSISQILIRR